MDKLTRTHLVNSLRHPARAQNGYDVVNDKKTHQKALDLIELEQDPNCRARYMTLWRDR